MSDHERMEAIAATDIPGAGRVSNYPMPFASRMGKRGKKRLGEHFGLKNFGVNLTRLEPGGESALMHAHSRQDELVCALEGEPTLMTESGQSRLSPGMCAGFPARGEAHHLVNRTDRDVVYLEIGDRTRGDEVRYPHDDIRGFLNGDGMWQFVRKDGTSCQVSRQARQPAWRGKSHGLVQTVRQAASHRPNRTGASRQSRHERYAPDASHVDWLHAVDFALAVLEKFGEVGIGTAMLAMLLTRPTNMMGEKRQCRSIRRW